MAVVVVVLLSSANKPDSGFVVSRRVVVRSVVGGMVRAAAENFIQNLAVSSSRTKHAAESAKCEKWIKTVNQDFSFDSIAPLLLYLYTKVDKKGLTHAFRVAERNRVGRCWERRSRVAADSR